MAGNNSSNIKDIHYEPKTKTLTVHFHSGATYLYHDVSPESYQAFMNAPSQGQHLHSHIKVNHRSTRS